MNATTLTQKHEATHEMQQHTQMSESAVATPTKLYRVDELAEEAGISLSYVYAIISREKPRVYAKAGKTHLYGQDFLDTINAMKPKGRKAGQKVKVIATHHTRLAKTLQAKVADTPEVFAFQSKESLLQRIDNLEKKVLQLSGFLGV